MPQATDDWYRVRVPALSTLEASIAFTHATSDLDFFVLEDVTGAQLDNSTTLTDLERVSLPRATSARDVLLAVRNYSKKNTRYTLDVVVDTLSPAPNDLCINATPLAFGETVTGDTSNDGNDLDLAYPSCGVYGTSGGDEFYALTLQPGQTLQATLESTANAALLLFEDCAAPCCWASADLRGSQATEVLRFTNPTTTALPLVLAVDGQGEGPFTLHVELP